MLIKESQINSYNAVSLFSDIELYNYYKSCEYTKYMYMAQFKKKHTKININK